MEQLQPVNFEIREMTIADYESVMALLQGTEGVCLRVSDARDATDRYLERNPGLSFVAVANDKVIACVMSGHDGRRGYLNHLAVAPQFRRRGLGSTLVTRSLEKLQQLGITKTHIDVLVGNESGIAFWNEQGWQLREDILRFSYERK